jgi:hypothetical protein
MYSEALSPAAFQLGCGNEAERSLGRLLHRLRKGGSRDLCQPADGPVSLQCAVEKFLRDGFSQFVIAAVR